MARYLKPGDVVVFNLITKHRCADKDHCACQCNLKVPATVVSVYSDAPDTVVLDVQFPASSIVDRRHEMLVDGETIYTTLTDHGFTGRQLHVHRATTSPPASGTWTAV